jgi:hypothetical protein
VVRAGHVTVIWVREGTDVEPLGGRLTTIPDVNGDGVPDLVSFDELAGREAGGDEAVGRVTVLSGRHGKLLWTLRGEESGDGLGAAVAPAGDVDRDGSPDIAVGAPQGGPTKAHRAPGVPWSVDERAPATCSSSRGGAAASCGASTAATRAASSAARSRGWPTSTAIASRSWPSARRSMARWARRPA